jgi:hypothetical protein
MILKFDADFKTRLGGPLEAASGSLSQQTQVALASTFRSLFLKHIRNTQVGGFLDTNLQIELDKPNFLSFSTFLHITRFCATSHIHHLMPRFLEIRWL